MSNFKCVCGGTSLVKDRSKALVVRCRDCRKKYTLVRTVPDNRPSKPEVNKPCSCGSGKKYKKCCGV